MGKSAVFSGLLHLAVVLLAVFGLPWLYDADEVLQVTPISVISEAQFAELKNQKPPAQQKKPEPPKEQEIPPAPKAPDVAQPEPEPEEPAPPEPAPPEPAPPEPVAQPESPPEPPQAEQQQPVVQPEPPPEPPQQVVAPAPTPEPEPQPVPPPEPQVAEAQPKPVPPKKPDPPKKKEDPKKKKEKDKPKEEQVATDDTSSFLKDIEKKLKKNQKKSQPQQQAALPQDSYDGPPLTEGERDMIREQVEGNMIYDVGMKGLEDILVQIFVQMNPDGSVQDAKIDKSGFNGNPNWYVFAESARRAVLKSSPLRMPPEKPYASWAKMTLVFPGREFLR